MRTGASKLDWNRMLGFEQVADMRESMRNERSATAIGGKTGTKVGTKVGNKIGVKVGLKVGILA